MRIIQGVGVTVGLSVRWRHQGFGIICPTCFLFRVGKLFLDLGFGIIWPTKDLGLFAHLPILFRVRKLFLYLGFAKDLGLFVQIETESENYFWIWDLGLLAHPRILNYLPNLLSVQHQSRKFFMFYLLLLINAVCFWRWPE